MDRPIGRRGSMDRPIDLRILLIGEIGSGKSASGNSILGRNVFRVGVSKEGVTKTSKKRKAVVSERELSVIDTPELSETSMTKEDLQAELVKCFYLSAPGPHVFLLVIRLDVRVTDEEINAMKWTQKIFGKNAERHTIILFTHADALMDKTLDEHILERPDLQNLINQCMCRYHAFNNNSRENKQVIELLKMIIEMEEENKGEYTNEIYKEAQRWSEFDFFKEQPITDFLMKSRKSAWTAGATAATKAATEAKEEAKEHGQAAVTFAEAAAASAAAAGASKVAFVKGAQSLWSFLKNNVT